MTSLIVKSQIADAPAFPSVKPASEITGKFNRSFLDKLPFEDTLDFVSARKGFIATIDPMHIVSSGGNTVYDGEAFNFLKSSPPLTVNPSLWRQSQLNTMHGLYKVTDHIYQIRGFDLSNMTIIEGETGWIVIDPLTSMESARAGLNLVNRELGDRPVVAVIHTHSHVDHFGGIRGVLTPEQIENRAVPIMAPRDFVHESISENVLAGNHMTRRASYMYGTFLPKNPNGNVGSGLGPAVALGSIGILNPTDEISRTGERRTIDGVDIVFQLTPGAEAPVEMMFYFPQFKALCQAEEVNHTLHNLYTLRGAKVRSGLLWSKWIHQAIELWGSEVEVSFGSHHWPTWGNKEVNALMRNQRDVYRYIHDETLRLANQGFTMNEIAEMVELPSTLAQTWENRDYYGTVNHNVKAQYQFYYGWFTGNPADLHPLPPVEESKKYIEYMGGREDVLSHAKADIVNGEYRFVSTALNHLVYANPQDSIAKYLLADVYEQLGYQAESGPWRNFYLSGAMELRRGITKGIRANTAGEDIVSQLSLELLFDNMAIALNGPKAANENLIFNFSFPDLEKKMAVYVRNGVLNYSFGIQEEDANASIVIDRAVFNQVILKKTTFQAEMKKGAITIMGNLFDFGRFYQLLDTYDFYFNIVTP